jgi:hypothetical protein
MIRTLLIIVYLVIGVIVASGHNYLSHLDGASAIISAILAVLLWPVVLLGADLHIGGLPKVKIKTKH